MDVVIFTEGGGEKGMGHIVRCQALSQALKEKGCAVRFVVDSSQDLSAILAGEVFENVSWQKDSAIVKKKLNRQTTAVMDSYCAPLELYAAVAGVGGQLFYFDDTNRMEYPRGVIINGAFLASSLHYIAKVGRTCLLGPEYQVLRKPFWDVPDKKPSRDVHNILVCMGGTDVRGLTPALVENLQERFPRWRLHVVKQNAEAMETATVKYYNRLSAQLMVRLMLSADLAVTGAGQTVFECIRCGLPVVAIGIAANQELNVKGMVEKGLGIFAGWWDEPKLCNSINKQLANLADYNRRVSYQKQTQKTIDGQAARRIAALIAEADV